MAQAARQIGVVTAYSEPGSPFGNGSCESFDSRMMEELLNGELFGKLREAVKLNDRSVIAAALSDCIQALAVKHRKQAGNDKYSFLQLMPLV